MTADGATLNDKASEFADTLTELTRGVLGQDSPRFSALHMGDRIRVAPIAADERILRIPISINGEPRLSLKAQYLCCWDRAENFLATDQADLHLHYAGVADPLLRYEYVRRSKEPPGAHLQVHAHRDELAYLIRLAHAGRPKAGMRRDRLPRLSEMHLPVGGHRMRPALEDMLLFLKREFAIDTADGWKNVLHQHLRKWRTIQLKAAVRDAPEAAADVLRHLGYTVEPPKVGHPRTPIDDNKLYWP